ncbi:MAG: hypothetical protein LBV74_15040 [Tannerella sp.]|nr:hypothetical protein [Tannerella sp.]
MRYFVFLAILLAFTSCRSTYFFATLDTSNEYVEKVENGDFLFETDSLWIAYCFKGENAPVQITAFNKTDKPFYIDWNRSALIIDNMAVTYAGEKRDYFEKWANSESVAASDNTTFIPPQSMVSEIPLYLSPNFEQIDNKDYRNAYVGNRFNEAFSVKRIDFEESATPLKFSSYLTIYAQPDKPMVFTQDFYLKNLIKATGVQPNDLANDMANRGDFFYTIKPANNSALYTTLTVIGVAGLAIVGAIYGEPVNIDAGYDND